MDPEESFKPGLYHLLDLHDKKAVRATTEQAQDYLEEYGGYLKTSLQNVLGVLQSAFEEREDKEKAIELFKQVLLEDPENLNALENSRVIHDQLGQRREAEDCARKVKCLLENGDSPQDLAARKARCLAGQGIAIRCHVDVKGLKVMDGDDVGLIGTAVKYFEKAIQVDDDENNMVFEPEERLQWQFFMGRSYYEVFERCLWKESVIEDKLDIFNKAVRTLIDVARDSNQDHYRAKAWTIIGTIFWKMSSFLRAYQPRIIFDRDLEREYNDPEICFVNARLSPEDPKILARYSRFLLQKRRFQDAIKISTKSIKTDGSKKNWFAISSRAKAYKMMFIEQNNAFKAACKSRIKGTPPQRELLMLAKKDYEYVIEITQMSQERIELGEVLSRLGEKEAALKQFQYVIDRLEGQKNVHVHTQMGFCLLGMTNSRLAVESFKRAVEIERSNLKHSFSPFKTLKFLLIMYDQGRPEHLLNEICYWLTQIEEKYEDQFFAKLIQSLGNQFSGMVRVCQRLVDQKMHNLATKCLSEMKGRDDPERKEIDQLEKEIETWSAGMSALSLSEAEQHTEPANIRPALGSSKNKKKTFDCLFLHCMEKADVDWVHYSLLPRLEEAHGYKCCVPARDIHPHSPRDFDSCVRGSGCVIVVLTPSFCRDAHCKDQLAKIVGAGSNMVIPVMREDCYLPDVLSGIEVIRYYSWELLLRDIEKSILR